MDSLLEEKKELLDKVHSLEHETEKLKKHLLEAGSKIETIQARLTDAEKRAQSAEMKLRTFLGKTAEQIASGRI
jgi:predicted  nucleic acid-binding Zn-ribbon protein